MKIKNNIKWILIPSFCHLKIKYIKGPITTNINFVNATEKNKESNVKIIRGLIHRINSQ